MRTETIDINDVQPNPWNPNEMVDSMFGYLRDSKNWFGDLIDIVVWEKESGEKIIVDGEHRYRADKENGKPTVNCKILNTNELMDMADGLINLSEEREEFASFKEIKKIEDANEKAEFVAKCLTIVMNSIKGEHNSEKLAEMFQTMEESTSIELLGTLLHMKEDAIEGYKYLLEEHNDEAESRIRQISNASQLNELKAIFKPEEWEEVKECLKHIGSKGNQAGMMNILTRYIELNNTEVTE